MVARSRPSDTDLDRLFRALADATRRGIVARVLAGVIPPTSCSMIHCAAFCA
jgi:hypothetical protein